MDHPTVSAPGSGVKRARFGQVPVAVAHDPVIAKSAIALRVAIYLCGYADAEGRVRYLEEQKQAAADLSITESRVSEAMKLLESRRVLFRSGKRIWINRSLEASIPPQRKSPTTPSVPLERDPTSAGAEIATSAGAEPYTTQTNQTDRGSDSSRRGPELRLFRTIACAFADAEIEARFNRWYDAFPTGPWKTGRSQACAKYLEVVRGRLATMDELDAGLAKYATAVATSDPRFIKKPANWLDEEAWKAGVQGGESPPIAEPERWRVRMVHYRRTGRWLPHQGPSPGERGCRVPDDLLTDSERRAKYSGAIAS